MNGKKSNKTRMSRVGIKRIFTLYGVIALLSFVVAYAITDVDAYGNGETYGVECTYAGNGYGVSLDTYEVEDCDDLEMCVE